MATSAASAAARLAADVMDGCRPAGRLAGQRVTERVGMVASRGVPRDSLHSGRTASVLLSRSNRSGSSGGGDGDVAGALQGTLATAARNQI